MRYGFHSFLLEYTLYASRQSKSNQRREEKRWKSKSECKCESAILSEIMAKFLGKLTPSLADSFHSCAVLVWYAKCFAQIDNKLTSQTNELIQVKRQHLNRVSGTSLSLCILLYSCVVFFSAQFLGKCNQIKYVARADEIVFVSTFNTPQTHSFRQKLSDCIFHKLRFSTVLNKLNKCNMKAPPTILCIRRPPLNPPPPTLEKRADSIRHDSACVA